MSSTQARTLRIDYSNSSNYGTYDSGISKGANYGVNCALLSKSSSFAYYHLNSAAKSVLYPNSIASPVKADYSTIYWRSVTLSSTTISIDFEIDGVSIKSASTTSISQELNISNDTNTAILMSTASSDIKVGLKTSRTSIAVSAGDADGPLVFTLYFTRYDFSASAGANVTSASVSSSTGYDGDAVTYSCVLASGAEFEGWYNGSTKVSSSQTYTHTVSGTDLALQARATMPVVTKTLSATYNGAQLQGFPMSVQADAPITYGGVSKGAVPFSGAAKTLQCAGKVCSGNIGIGGKTLQCTNKLMTSDIVCQIS